MLYMHFCYYRLLEEGVAVHLNRFEYALFKNALCQLQDWLKLAEWSGKKNDRQTDRRQNTKKISQGPKKIPD